MSKENFYNEIAKDFDSIMNMYDTNRRIEVIFEDFLGNEDLNNKLLLDGGCGTGHFTTIAMNRNAKVTAIDLANKLVAITKDKNPNCNAITGSLLELPFPDEHFDYVISSDVIEHTTDPYLAVKELIRVLKPGGKICITVPNKTFWFFSLKIAEVFKLRKYQGYENWLYYYRFKRFLSQNDIELIHYKGIHLFPFLISKLNPLLKKIDKKTDEKLGFMMVNIAAYGKKK
jgi:ubiquinone/menaquinone biosynthesis C-methylase UbiE